MVKYEVSTEHIDHTDTTKHIDLEGCSSVLVEILSGNCYVDDVAPLRATELSDAEKAIAFRLFTCDGVFNSKISVSKYSDTNHEYSLLITRTKPVVESCTD